MKPDIEQIKEANPKNPSKITEMNTALDTALDDLYTSLVMNVMDGLDVLSLAEVATLSLAALLSSHYTETP